MIILSGVVRRAFGIVGAPRATFESVTHSPRWLGILTLTFLIAAASSAIVLETKIGQLALLDQWERIASAFGQPLDDAEYATLARASRNGAAYAVLIALVTGPILAFALSALIFVGFRAAAGSTVTFQQVLAIVTHAGVILALRQVVVAPVTYATESATPITMGMFLPVLDEVSPFARFFGIIDLFVVWWAMVLAIGMSVVYRRPARRLAGVFVGAYVALAVVVTAVMAATGGTA